MAIGDRSSSLIVAWRNRRVLAGPTTTPTLRRLRVTMQKSVAPKRRDSDDASAAQLAGGQRVIGSKTQARLSALSQLGVPRAIALHIFCCLHPG